jgi:acetylornithine deacetylase/succinyl-diaminopimelate desuccinylase-like protein
MLLAADPLSDAIARAGLSGVPRESLAGDEDRYLGFFEAHIEQGPFLEAKSTSIGVVSACVGIFGGDIFFHGQQNHAGTTPMELRKVRLLLHAADFTQFDRNFNGNVVPKCGHIIRN